MRREWLGVVVSLPLLFASVALAQPAQETNAPGDGLLLIQSELSHLDGAEQRISLRVKDASPSDTLDHIERAAQFAIEVEGKLPRTPKLTVAFQETPARDVLVWFAKEVDVVYRVERGGKLVVFTRPGAELQ